VRARAIDVAMHSIDGEAARAHEADFLALGQSVHDLLDDLEPGMGAPAIAELERCLELRWERDRLERRLGAAKGELHRAYEERTRRRVREWFAEGLPVAVLADEPMAAIESEEQARSALATAEARLASAEAACPPKPARAVQESLADWSGAVATPEVSSDLRELARAAAAAQQEVTRLARPGPQPMWTVAKDIPVVYRGAEMAWWVAVVAAPLTSAVAIVNLLMGARGGEDVGFWQMMQAASVLGWAAVFAGWFGKRTLDAFLRRKHTSWLERTAAIDAAHRAIGWPYVVRRAEVEQRGAEVAALREYVTAAARAREFDRDPELGGKLAELRLRDAELGAHVDGATSVLAWASEKGWARA
jgi:hypothetical protein